MNDLKLYNHQEKIAGGDRYVNLYVRLSYMLCKCVCVPFTYINKHVSEYPMAQITFGA